MSRKVWVPTVSGPLAPYAAGFESWLASQAYSRWAAADRVYQFDQLSRWLAGEGLAVDELTDEQAERFAAARRAAGVVMWAAPHSASVVLGYLRELGVAPAPVAVLAQGPLEELLAAYGEYLSIERGLCDHTVFDAYVPAARVFLCDLDGGDELDLGQLTAVEVSSFLVRECEHRSVSGTRDLVCALRSLLRYLHLAGLTTTPLVWAVPSVADLRDRSLPRGMDPAAVRRLLASCDRRRLVGRRDFAILLLLVRLGLRAGEVAAIALDDIDWRAGMLLVHGKGSREDALPLPSDVGEAIVSYLRRRPRCECRALFLRVTAPRKGLSRCTVAWVVRAACDRAGLPRVGAHRLRHTAATQMLRAGASLPEIGQVLRHRESKTTAIYAKVDETALRALARPWPTHEWCLMSALRTALEEYLLIRRRLGFAMPQDGRLLEGFVGFLEQAGVERITTELALGWARLPVDAHPFTWHQRLDDRAGFCPPSGHTRPSERGAVGRSVAGASSADRPLHLLLGGDRGVDGGRAATRAAIARSPSRDVDRAVGRDRLPPRRGAGTRPDRCRSHPRGGASAGRQEEQAATSAAAPKHRRCAPHLRRPA